MLRWNAIILRIGKERECEIYQRHPQSLIILGLLCASSKWALNNQHSFAWSASAAKNTFFFWRGPFPMPYQPYHHHTSFYFIYLDPISRKCWLHCNTTPTRVCIVMNGPEARMPGWVSNCIFDINECLMVFVHSFYARQVICNGNLALMHEFAEFMFSGCLIVRRVREDPTPTTRQ